MKIHPQLLTEVLADWKNSIITAPSKDFYNVCNNDLQQHKSLYGNSLDVFIEEEVYQRLLEEFYYLKIKNTPSIKKFILQHDLEEDDKKCELVEDKPIVVSTEQKDSISLTEQKEVWLNAWQIGIELSNSSTAEKWANECLDAYINRFK